MEKVKLEEVVWFQEGPGVRNTQYTLKGVKLLNVANLVNGKIDLTTSERFISEEEANGKYSHFLCEDGDLIIASSGIKVEYIDKKIGFVEKSMLPLCMNTSTIRFKVKNDHVLIKYVYYFFKSLNYKKQIDKLITGSAQLNYGPSHLSKVYIQICKLNLQQKIVEELDTISEVIEKKKEQLKNLDLLIKSQFIESFDRIFSSNATTAISDISNKKIDRLNKKFNDGIVIKYIDISSIDNSINQIKSVTEYKMSKKPSRAQQIIIKGDILISTVRPNLKNIAIINYDYKNLICSTGFCVLRVRENANRLFILEILKSDIFTNYLINLTSGATYPAVSNSDIYSFRFNLPPIDLQNQFADFVTRIEKIKEQIKSSLVEAENCYSSLMQKYFD